MTRTYRLPGILATVCSLPLLATAASAADADQGSGSGEGSSNALQEVVVTSSYKEQSDNSMKMGIAVRDTPLSIESYTNSFMTSIETQQVADLYRYMTGLQKAGITGYNLTIRGFSTIDSDRNTFLTDGLPGLAVRFGSPPTIGTDHIELVKGAASLLYGQTTPGGFVNIITKKPQDQASTQIETRGTLNASNYSRVRGGDVSFDSTGPLGSDRVLYRVVGQISDDRYFRNFSYERGKYLVPMVTVKLGEATTATAQFEYRSVSADYENVGLLAPYTPVAATVERLAPIQTVYTAPGTSRDERGTTASFFLKHDFADRGSLNVSLRSVDHHDYAYAFDITGFDKKDPRLQTLDLRARGQSNQRTYNFGDVNLVLPFDTGFLQHRLIVGANAGKEIDDFRRTKFCAINSPGNPRANPKCNIGADQFTVSVYDPNFSDIPPPGAFGAGSLADNYIVSETAAGYLSDLVTLSSHWKALAGVRYSKDKLTAYANKYSVGVPPAQQTTSTTLPQAGIIYQPNSHWSYYASYSTSYTPIDPSTQGLVTSPLFKPSEGKGGEVGVKADFLHHRINVTGALFVINQTNVLTPYAGGTDALCPTGSCMVQVGAARSKGAEIELDAKPTAALTFIAGYAYTNAYVTQSSATGPIVGDALPNSPRNAFHLWSRYDVLSGALRGFGGGLGLSYVGSRVANTGTPALPGEFILPGYEVVDFAFYKTFANGLDITVKVNNLLDKTYYQDGAITSGMVSVDAGTPRTAELYLNWTFQ
jgi:iron complex outermembrane receptor protein